MKIKIKAHAVSWELATLNKSSSQQKKYAAHLSRRNTRWPFQRGKFNWQISGHRFSTASPCTLIVSSLFLSIPYSYRRAPILEMWPRPVVNSVCRAAILLRLLLTLESKKASISATFAPSSLIKASLHDWQHCDKNRGKFLCAYKPSSTILAPFTLVSESSWDIKKGFTVSKDWHVCIYELCEIIYSNNTWWIYLACTKAMNVAWYVTQSHHCHLIVVNITKYCLDSIFCT